ncbi:MAG: hypothetical protein ACFFAO_08035 [Candidatus Hermodarchaeota archaeon]
MLTPKKIYEDFINNKLSKETATELLISIIEGSYNEIDRVKCIEAFVKLSLNNQKIFRIVENCLVSDKNPLVRKSAAIVIFSLFPKKYNFIPLNWVIKFENSILVIHQLLELFESVNDPHYTNLKDNLIKRLTKIYDVDSNEIPLILNLGVIYTELTEDYDLNMNYSWYKIMHMVRNSNNPLRLIQRLHHLNIGGTLEPLPKSIISVSNLRKYFMKNLNIRLYHKFWDREKSVEKIL